MSQHKLINDLWYQHMRAQLWSTLGGMPAIIEHRSQTLTPSFSTFTLSGATFFFMY